MNKPVIDFVVTWVDGNDPLWQEEKSRHAPGGGTDSTPARYRDLELMRFWFRGVEQFAPWVNKIHFVTWGHLPKWLNTEHPKLNIVRHEDFIPREYLPTFNSNAIELGMHRIPGLAQQFVYFNDDMFLLRPVEPEDFFRDGVPVDSAVLSPVMPVWQDEISRTILNDMFIINKHFQVREVLRRNRRAFFSLKNGSGLLRTLCLLPWRHFPGFYNDHLPVAYLRSTFEQVWKQEGELLAETMSHRFRDYGGDVSHWLMRYWQLCALPVFPARAGRGKYLELDSADSAGEVARRRCSMVCINDTVSGNGADDAADRIRQAFSFLDRRSGFEKQQPSG